MVFEQQRENKTPVDPRKCVPTALAARPCALKAQAVVMLVGVVASALAAHSTRSLGQCI